MSETSNRPMMVMPAGTVIFEPDAINQVTLMFPSQDDAVIFYEWLISITESAPFTED